MSDIARTILAQLGGNRFAAMTGAHSFCYGERALSFRIPSRNKLRAGAVRVTLTGRDDYDVEFLAVRGFKAETVRTLEGLYCDQLRDQLGEALGLATHL